MSDDKYIHELDALASIASADLLPIEDQDATDVLKYISINQLQTFILGGVAITAHASRHQNGGADEISVLNLSGLLADAQTPLAHNQSAATITTGTLALARGGTNNTSYTDGKFLIYDLAGGNIQSTPFSDSSYADAAHKTQHQNGGGDEISVEGLNGALADAQTPTAHDNTYHSTNYATKAEFDSHNGSDAQHGHDDYLDDPTFVINGNDYLIENGHIKSLSP